MNQRSSSYSLARSCRRPRMTARRGHLYMVDGFRQGNSRSQLGIAPRGTANYIAPALVGHDLHRHNRYRQ